jgi:hypothetical protein
MKECVQASLARDNTIESRQKPVARENVSNTIRECQESIYKTLRLHKERELGAIKDGTWTEGNVTMILQKDHKLKKIVQY